MRKRVVVAMSGGVDSSVAACLLKERGFEVIGATMRIWNDARAKTSEYRCCGAADVEDARRVAQQIGIPFYVFNLEEEFDKEVIQYFCDEYDLGRTPNPCILCNEKVKFGALLEKALSLDAELFSTGHYASSVYDEEAGRYVLRRGADRGKDQSYVLFSLSQDQLARAVFPLGEMRKADVRKKAFDLGLRLHDKPESQEICFVPEPSYHSFLSARLKGCVEAGPILDRKGNVLGTHKGIAFYTIGQRRGLGIAAGRPLFVNQIDRRRNAIVVGEEDEVYARTFTADRVNWISFDRVRSPMTVEVKIRYSHPGAEGVVTAMGGDEVRVTLHSAQKAITPGQAAVFYRGETVLGGGWIKEVAKDEVPC